MRIVQVTHSMEMGGSNVIAQQIRARWPDSRDTHYMAVCTGALEGPLGIADIRLRGTPKLSTIPADLFSTYQMVRALQPDLVISHGYGINHVVLLAKALGLFRGRVVVVEHGSLVEQIGSKGMLGRRVAMYATRVLYRRASRVVAVSTASAVHLRHMTGIGEDGVTVVPGGIDADAICVASQIAPPKLDPRVSALPRPWVVAVGRLVPEKDFPLLMYAFRYFSATQGGSCIVVGDGPLRAELEDLSVSMGLAESVHFVGESRNPYWFMRSANIYVMTSRTEALPLVLLEAAACGASIVAPGFLPGAREALEGYAHTVFFDEASPRAVSVALRTALAMKPVRRATQIPDCFRVESMLDSYRRIVSEVCV